MARGGARAGAGRPRGSSTRRIGISGIPQTILREAASVGETPLNYMLRILNDPSADDVRRDKMAQVAAPYCHPRIAERTIGSKERAIADAEQAGQGTEWAEILRPLDAARR